MDPNNPVVKLCAAGMQAEAEGGGERAKALFLEAWGARVEAFDGCVAAHYVARHQSAPEDELRWNQQALDHADRADPEQVRGFYSSLHLNLGRSLEAVNRRPEAARHYRLAREHLGAVPAGPYGDLIRSGLAAADERMGRAGAEPVDEGSGT